MVYRRLKGSDTWHWCRNCSKWPNSNYDERNSKPTTGELDNECRAKDGAGNCRKSYSPALSRVDRRVALRSLADHSR